jgi:ribose transport system permease protein
LGRDPKAPIIKGRKVDSWPMAKGILRKVLIVLILPCAVYARFYILQPKRFGTLQTLYIMFQQAFLPSISAWGLCFVMTLGLYDLSIGAIIILSAIVGTNLTLAIGTGFGYVWLFLICLSTAVVLEFINASGYNFLKIPSMIVTIGLMILYETAANFAGNAVLPYELSIFGKAPYNVIVGLFTLIIAYLLYNRTQIGMQIKAVGGSEIVARNAGVDVRRVKMYGFLLCGVFLGIASFLSVSYGGVIIPSTRMSSILRLFPPLMGYFIGIALKKVCNIIIGIFVGEMVIIMVVTGMVTMGVPTTYQQVITGLFLLAVVGIAVKAKKDEVVK